MGLRSRLKSLARDLVGRPPPVVPATSPTPPPAPTMAPPAAPQARPAAPSAAPPPSPPPPPVDEGPAPSAPSAPSAEGPSPEEKAARHLARTRQGLLRHIIANGGTISLGALHEHSERRYFIGHKKFSDLMEAMIAADELTYDPEKAEATITPSGRRAAEA